MRQGASYAITTILNYAIIVIGAMTVFGSLGVSWDKLQWLAAALSVGLGFGLQEIFGNFVSGLIILFERPVRIGDTVTIGTFSGTVSKIRIRATTITDFDRKEVIIPNKAFVTERLINWSLSDTVTRVVIRLGVAYGSDLDKVKEAGFPKPRVEGLENGEWIIVDCGMAVCHIMQPMIRAYYHLEDIWGEKVAKPVKDAAKKATTKTKAKPAAEKKPVAKKAVAKKAVSKTLASSAPAKKAPVKKVAAKKAASKTVAAPAAAPAKKVAAKKVAAKKAVAAKAPAAPAAPAKKAAAKKTVAKKVALKKAAAK